MPTCIIFLLREHAPLQRESMDRPNLAIVAFFPLPNWSLRRQKKTSSSLRKGEVFAGVERSLSKPEGPKGLQPRMLRGGEQAAADRQPMAEDLCRAAEEGEIEEDRSGWTPLQIDLEEGRDGVATLLRVARAAQATPVPSGLSPRSAEVGDSPAPSPSPSPDPQTPNCNRPGAPVLEIQPGT